MILPEMNGLQCTSIPDLLHTFQDLVIPSWLHEVNLTTVWPTTVHTLSWHHPNRGPQKRSSGKFGTCLDPSILEPEPIICLYTAGTNGIDNLFRSSLHETTFTIRISTPFKTNLKVVQFRIQILLLKQEGNLHKWIHLEKVQCIRGQAIRTTARQILVCQSWCYVHFSIFSVSICSVVCIPLKLPVIPAVQRDFMIP